jgi:hypothetical protein
MFLRTKQKKEEEKKALEKQSYVAAMERVFKYGKKTLAIARMSYWEGYDIRKGILGEIPKSPDNYVMNGVIHEQGWSDKHILCEVNFSDERASDDVVGWCHLNEVTICREQGTETPTLSFEVTIHDASSEWRRKAYSTLRDAAISGHQFCHIRVTTEELDAAPAVAQFQEKGYGPRMKVFELAMWPQVILAKAPTWGWKRYYEY